MGAAAVSVSEAALAAIERNVAAGRTLPGRDAYALTALTLLVGEVRRLRDALREYGLHKAECVHWRIAPDDLRVYGEGGACCDCGFVEARRS